TGDESAEGSGRADNEDHGVLLRAFHGTVWSGLRLLSRAGGRISLVEQVDQRSGGVLPGIPGVEHGGGISGACAAGNRSFDGGNPRNLEQPFFASRGPQRRVVFELGERIANELAASRDIGANDAPTTEIAVLSTREGTHTSRVR